MNQNRQPRGIPTGGQFASSARGEQDGLLLDDGYADPSQQFAPPTPGLYRPAEDGDYQPRFVWETVDHGRSGLHSYPCEREQKSLLPGETFNARMAITFDPDTGYSWSTWSNRHYDDGARGTAATLAEAIEAAEASSANDLTYVGKGSRTPWGKAQHAELIYPGVMGVSTAGHGGAKVNAQRNKQIPTALRNRSGWYEEDCEMAIVSMYFDPDQGRRQRSVETVKNWFPHEYTKATGEPVQQHESYMLRKEAADEASEGRWVAVSGLGKGDGTSVVKLNRMGRDADGRLVAVESRIVSMPAKTYAARYEQTEFAATFTPDEVAGLADTTFH